MGTWLTWTYDECLHAWVALAVAVGVIMYVRREIPRGSKRTSRSSLAVTTKTGWVLKELPAVVHMCYWFFGRHRAPVPVAWVFFCAYTMHYTYRIVVYPLLLRTRARNITLANLAHTTWFHFCNEGLIGYWLAEVCNYESSWLMQPCFLCGWIIFSLGFSICVTHDVILISMRRPGVGSGVYVPEGGLFNFVACANYFGECVEWGGFALMTWSGPGFAFFLWSCANLVPTAIANHEWYRKEFGRQYPRNRKAIFPFVL